MSLESCFTSVSQCQAEQVERAGCVARAQACFQRGHGGFHTCFKQLASCAEPEHGHEDEDEDAHCGCSCQMSGCFDRQDQAACSDMFEVCFHPGHGHGEVEEEEGGHGHNHEDAGYGDYDAGCLDQVRECSIYILQ